MRVRERERESTESYSEMMMIEVKTDERIGGVREIDWRREGGENGEGEV